MFVALIILIIAVADPVFPRRGCVNILFGKMFVKNYIKQNSQKEVKAVNWS